MDSENFNNHHGTSTAFLTNFTKTVKLTKTLIACHYWRWNSFSCDYFNKSWKLLESGFPDQYFGRSMWDRKPYCELSSHSLHHACACTCNGIHEISEHGVSEFGHMACQNSDIYIYIFFFFPRVSPMSFLKLRETHATRVFYTGEISVYIMNGFNMRLQFSQKSWFQFSMVGTFTRRRKL